MWSWQDNQLVPLPPQALQEAARRIDIAKRDLDLLAHFEMFSYALLLPGTESAGAAMLAHRIMEMLRSKIPPAEDGEVFTEIPNPALAFGIAGIPEDCIDMGLLLTAAKTSKLMAQSNSYPIVMFKDLQSPESVK
jgi:GGDEF domain-containing protein